ncbi:hypothetical protein ACFOD4_02105 [Pseudoroseomonas globiformis]|uniref:Uncharacterized protein n=1 Tax=Teichococcus globiformis TaxID=2307229 RepID=A0ABV7FTZ9_9PROT
MRGCACTVAAVAMLALGPVPAAADWRYTRWGMTPDEVAAASGGTVQVVPVPEGMGQDPFRIAATGRFHAEGLEWDASFTFNTDGMGVEQGGGLVCVTYLALDDVQSVILLHMLKRDLGPPEQESAVALPGQKTLSWRTDTDRIDADFYPGSPGYVAHCALDAPI